MSRLWSGPRVFGVGLNKTGTTSLTHALADLGYRPIHHNGLGLSDADISERVGRAVAAGRHPLTHARRLAIFDAFFDVRAVEAHFEAFDRAFPGSKFILHTRDVDGWTESRRKHVERNIARGRGTWTVLDEDAWRSEFEAHHRRVRDYFAGRDDLLEIDLATAEGWEPLVDFLGVPAPDRPFPHVNAVGTANPSRRFHWLKPRRR